MNVASEERRVALDDGTATMLECWGESGPIVLAVHGITSSRRSWARLGEALSGTYRTFAYDQRGHGDSAGVAGPMSLARSVRDLETVAATLPGPVHAVIGHSWGGAVALLGGLALRPACVVAVDPMVRVPPRTFETEYVDDVREVLSLEPVARESALREMYAGLAPPDVAAKLHAMMAMSAGTLERLGRDNGVDDGQWDVRDRLVDYPVPLLVFVAGVESVLAPDDVAWLETRGGPNVTTRVVAGEGHNLHRSAFERFARDTEAFLGSG